MTKIRFDAKNEYGLNFWETAWKNTGGIESFSPHSRFIEEVKYDLSKNFNETAKAGMNQI